MVAIPVEPVVELLAASVPAPVVPAADVKVTGTPGSPEPRVAEIVTGAVPATKEVSEEVTVTDTGLAMEKRVKLGPG